jgi:hypothetical protein
MWPGMRHSQQQPARPLQHALLAASVYYRPPGGPSTPLPVPPPHQQQAATPAWLPWTGVWDQQSLTSSFSTMSIEAGLSVASPTLENFPCMDNFLSLNPEASAPSLVRPELLPTNELLSPSSPPLPEFHELTSPASSLSPQPSSRLLVYSWRRRDIAEEAGTTVGVAVSAETPLTAMGAGDQPAVACQQPLSEAIIVPDKVVVAAGVEASAETPLAATNTTPTIAAGVEASAETPLAATNTTPTIAAGVEASPETPLAAAHTDDHPSTTTIHQVPASTGVVVPRVTPPVIEIPPPSREAFITRIARQTVSILAVPSTVKRCTKANLAGQTPRRSCRLAGIQAEFNMSELERRSRKKAMRALGIITEQEGVTEQAQEDYANVFKQCITEMQVEALAALFNWAIPDFTDHDSEAAVLA